MSFSFWNDCNVGVVDHTIIWCGANKFASIDKRYFKSLVPISCEYEYEKKTYDNLRTEA